MAERKPKTTPKKKAESTPKLLSGGNPQIPKGYGDAPVEAYLAAMPGWKQAVGRRLDALIVGAVPGVYKAVKWNTPFYGFEGEGWFVAFHCFNKYVKVTFFRGTSLDPIPPRHLQAARGALPRRLRRPAVRRGAVCGLGEAGESAAGGAAVTG